MPIRVLTIEREYGSGGAAIAERLAQRLGWRLWDKEVTGEIGRLAAPAVAAPSRGSTSPDNIVPHDPLLYRLAKVFARGSYERSLPLEASEGRDAEYIIQLMTRAIERIGANGSSVIVGRGGAYILRNHPESFHAFIFAPYDEKLRRVLATGKSRAEATELLDTVDSERADFVKRYTGRDWPSRYLYDVWINSVVGDEAVVETIVDLIARLDRQGFCPRAARTLSGISGQ